MNDYIDNLYFDIPINYGGLDIYPVTMRDYITFHSLVGCLQLDKNSIPDINIINMTYLRYLYYEAYENKQPYLYMLNMLLHLVMHIPENEEIHFYTREDKAFLSIRDIELGADDFDKIVDIIFLQNNLKHIDETIQKELRDALEEAERYKAQQNQNKICSLEDQMICVMISTPLKLEDIYNLTIRKFEKILQRVDAKLHYQIYKSASMSGFVEFKDKNAIQHWMNDFDKAKEYEDVMVDLDTMRSKIDLPGQ